MGTGRRVRVFLLALVSCTQTNVHDTPQAKNESCVTCHQAAYDNTPDPPHADAGFPTTCADCHSQTAWIPAKGGHVASIETAFPISTGSHANAAIGCGDCHKPSLGSNTAGANCDCIHCHIGAHIAPDIDSTHAGVSGYTPSGSSAANYCLTCHPSG